jgi:Zn-dependent protease with chaperone function
MGHFAQGSGMRLTYLVRSVNGWLARVVYQRDAWDEKLTEWSNRSVWPVAVCLWAAQCGVWMSREALWVLMVVGHAIGMRMQRQMEYDADRYEARLAGSDTFASTALAMRVLTESSRRAILTLTRSYRERRLANDYPALVALMVTRLPDHRRRGIKDVEGGNMPGPFDTHPPDAARVERAHAEPSAGICHLEHPAAQLFGDLSALCRRATEIYYQQQHEIDLAGVKLEPPREILHARTRWERSDPC